MNKPLEKFTQTLLGAIAIGYGVAVGVLLGYVVVAGLFILARMAYRAL